MLEQMTEPTDRFLTATKFEALIDKMVYDSDYTYIEAIIEYCEENGLDPEDTVRYINNNLKKKIEMEAIICNYLPKKSTLDFAFECDDDQED